MTVLAVATCRACTRPLFTRGTPTAVRPEGSRQHASRGLCGTCYRLANRRGELDQYPLTSTDPSTYVPARVKSPTFGAFQLSPSHLRTGTTNPGPGLQLVDTGDTHQIDPDTARAASRVVAGRARDAADARHLLGVLGLLEEVTA